MFTLPNIISFLRVPLALLFLYQNPSLRVLVIFLAMLTDVLDGFLARRWQQCSRFGVVIDPLMDKFFALFVLTVFISEQSLTLWQAMCMLSRDIALIIFGACLFFSKKWTSYRFKAIQMGKISTSLQFLFFIALVVHYPIQSYLYSIFILLGIGSLAELLLRKHQQAQA